MKPIMVLSFVLAMLALASNLLKFVKGTVNTAQVATEVNLQQVSQGSQDWVIQFKNSVKESDKKEFIALGAKIFRYIPDDALIVRANKSSLDQYQAKSGKITGIVPFRAEWKMATNLPTISVFSIGHREHILLTTFDASELTND